MLAKIVVLHLSNETTPGCLGFIGDDTTQACGDYNKTIHHKDHR